MKMIKSKRKWQCDTCQNFHKKINIIYINWLGLKIKKNTLLGEIGGYGLMRNADVDCDTIEKEV